MGPVGPVAPVTPVTPVTPLGPIAPVAPVGPALPLGPIAPVAPVGPVAPVNATAQQQTLFLQVLQQAIGYHLSSFVTISSASFIPLTGHLSLAMHFSDALWLILAIEETRKLAGRQAEPF